MTARAVRVVGAGRAGRSLAAAFEKAGWRVAGVLGRDDRDAIADAAQGVDVVVIATPDAAVAEVAASIVPVPSTVVAHVAGSLGLDVLAPHDRRASFHPLRAIATPTTDLDGAWFAVAGDAVAREAVGAIGGRVIELSPNDEAGRVRYHAAGVMASNHLVALLGQVERIAATVGVPLAAFLDLVRGTIDNVEVLGPAAALTGPVSRGDWATVERHLAAIPEDERPAYRAMAGEAAKLVGER